MRRVLVALAIVVGVAGTATAHQSSIKYADITVDGSTAQVKLTIAPTDVTQPLGQADTATPTVADVLAPATVDRVTAFVASWVTLRDPSGAPCSITSPRAGPDPDAKFVDITYTAVCHVEITKLTLDFTRFFALDQRHEAIVSVHARGEQVEPMVVRSSEPVLEVTPGQATSLLGWIRHGMDHIYGGLDHIAFVLSLLLVVVLTRTSEGWQVRTPVAALRSTALVITAFTVGHSISLILASLGYISLPSRFVESVIAGSIVYTAVEDVIRPDVTWRFVLTFCFGLIHGLGFASVLADLLPKEQVLLPLVTFNVGVEIGQLTIVLAAIPVCWGIARLVGAQRYRRYVLPALALPLVVVGLRWLVERAFDM